MDLKFPRKSLLERGGFSSAKRVAFLAVASLLVVVGIGLRAGHYFGDTPAEEKAPVAVEAPAPAAPPTAEISEPVPKTPPATQEAETAPSEPAEQAGDPAGQAVPEGAAVEQADLPEGVDPSMILVSKQPVEVLASPSSTAPAMFGFPAGRPFRVISRDNGFIQIKDLRSGASGWIEEAALTPARRAEPVATPSQPKPSRGKPATTSADSKPKATKKDTQVTSDSEAADEGVQTRKPPGLFGKGGLFGGIFGGN